MLCGLLLLSLTPAPQEPTRDQLEAIAAAIDPGPREPLRSLLPAWWRDGIAKLAEPTPEQAAATFQGDPWWRHGQDYSTLHKLELGARAAIALDALERVTEKGTESTDALRALRVAYAALAPGNSENLSTSNLGGALLQGSARALRIDGAQTQELLTLDPDLGQRAGELLAHHTARALRAPASRRDLASTLADATITAWYELHDPDMARKWAELAIRAAAAPTTEDWLMLAVARYRALDVEAGDPAIGSARQAPGKQWAMEPDAVAALRLERLFRRAQHERDRNAALRGSLEGDSVEAKLARAQRLAIFHSRDHIEAEIARIARAHPTDPRPLTTQLALAIGARDTRRAQELLDAHRAEVRDDRALTVTALVVSMLGQLQAMSMADQAPGKRFAERVLAEIAALRDGLADQDDELAQVLRLTTDNAILAQGMTEPGVLRSRLVGLLAPAIALQDRLPDSSTANELLQLGALFAPDVEAGRAALAIPAPAGIDPIGQTFRRAQIGIALAFKAGRLGGEALPETLREIEPLLADLSRAAGGDTIADGLRALAHAAGLAPGAPVEQWRAARERLAANAPPPGLPRRGPVLNALAVASYHDGLHEVAAKLWGEAHREDHRDLGIAWFNQAVAAQQRQPAARYLDALAGFASNDRPARAIRIQAHAWLAHFHRAAGDEPTAKRHFAAAAALLADVIPLDPGFPPVSTTGVSAHGSANWGLKTSFFDGISFDVDVDVELWLILPAPFTNEQIETEAGK